MSVRCRAGTGWRAAGRATHSMLLGCGESVQHREGAAAPSQHHPSAILVPAQHHSDTTPAPPQHHPSTIQHHPSTMPVPPQHYPNANPAPFWHHPSTTPVPSQYHPRTIQAPFQHHSSTTLTPSQHHSITPPALLLPQCSPTPHPTSCGQLWGWHCSVGASVRSDGGDREPQLPHGESHTVTLGTAGGEGEGTAAATLLWGWPWSCTARPSGLMHSHPHGTAQRDRARRSNPRARRQRAEGRHPPGRETSRAQLEPRGTTVSQRRATDEKALSSTGGRGSQRCLCWRHQKGEAAESRGRTGAGADKEAWSGGGL